jgi:hypothetical protein
MARSECDLLKVDVPVGFLLPEAREILVSVDRGSEAPLSIRLRLVPAEAEVDGMTDLGVTPPRSSHDTPMPARWLTRRRETDGYPEHEIGGGD